MLAPQNNKARSIYSLDGVWDFKLDEDDEGLDGFWMSNKLYAPRPIPVPSSFNEISFDIDAYREDNIVWYQRTLDIPERHTSDRIFLRLEHFSGALEIFIDDENVASLASSSTPYEIDITSKFTPGENSLLTIRLDARNLKDSDQFAYAGLDGNIMLVCVPDAYIEDIYFATVGFIPLATGGLDSAQARYEIVLSDEDTPVKLELKDFQGKVVAESDEAEGTLEIPRPTAWSPKLPYLYTLCVASGDDYYEQKVGLRQVAVFEDGLTLNQEPIRLSGFNYEAMVAGFGRALSDAQIIKDFELMRWMGANAIFSSKGALSEQFLNLADTYGMLVIETPDSFDETGVKNLLARDKNHPSLITLAYVPDEQNSFADFKNHVIEFDYANLPLAQLLSDKAALDDASNADLLIFSPDLSKLEELSIDGFVRLISKELTALSENTTKPVVVYNFTPQAHEGKRSYFEELGSEDFQVAVLAELGRIFDANAQITGEFINHFTDIKLSGQEDGQNSDCAALFTIERQAKTSAYTQRVRWYILSGKAL
ncbi:MAG: glycoside hydrolase family 2 TIM barrel-domain containing protein [Coriobacteriia bacterium]|nr:glycoside hydrolase family 2 TIM barrel-domain containing protein [Coriobacteriia bacterium]